mmetsp:Transcript_59301/g.133102  ORF Transcript_59301/g.133102 Transcript_59301/m.133102 type:complete len:740 (-) Transcript_59301:86-2305(-)
MVEPDDADVDEFLCNAGKQVTDKEAERELLTWGGSVKSERAQPSADGTVVGQVKPLHYNIHTPLNDVHVGSQEPVTGLSLVPSVPLESVGFPEGRPEEDADAGTKPSQGTTEEPLVVQEKASVRSDADSLDAEPAVMEHDITLGPMAPPESIASAVFQPDGNMDAAAEPGIRPSAQTTEPALAMRDSASVQSGTGSRGSDDIVKEHDIAVSQPALVESTGSTQDWPKQDADSGVKPSKHAIAQEMVVSVKAAPLQNCVDGKSVNEHLNSLSGALAGVHNDVHRMAAENRKVELQFQAIDGRQANLEKGQSDLGLRLQQLETQLQSFADTEVSPLTWSYSNLHERVVALERSQKTVAKGVRRMLQSAPPNIQTGFVPAVHQPTDQNWSPSGGTTPGILSTLPTPAGAYRGLPDQILDDFRDQLQHHEQRIAELDAFCSVARMELRPPRSMQRASQDGDIGADSSVFIERQRELAAADLATLRRDVDALLQGEVSEQWRSTPHAGSVHQPLASRPWRTPLLSQDSEPLVDQSSLELRLDTRLDARLEDMRQRLDLLRQALEQCVQVQLADLSREVPQATARIENLTLQCQNCLAKVEAHDVRIGMLSTALDLQERRLQGTVERIERSATTITASRLERESALVAATSVLTGRVDAHANVLDQLRDRLLALSGHVKLGASRLGGRSQGFPSPVSSRENLLDVVAASRLEPVPWSPSHGNGAADFHGAHPGHERGLDGRAPMR